LQLRLQCDHGRKDEAGDLLPPLSNRIHQGSEAMASGSMMSMRDSKASHIPLVSGLPASLVSESRDDVAVLRLARPQKRNALDSETVVGIGRFFSAIPETVKAVLLHGEGEHFCAGLDLNEIEPLGTIELIELSRRWHQAFDRIEFGKVPVIAVLHGAVIGGGLELAAAAHIRVAERSAFYALPEASRGIFVGGGGSVRLPRLIGTARMMDMILTGRTYGAEEGWSAGFSQYVIDAGEGLATAFEIARKIASNSSLSNFAAMHALPRIAEEDRESGFLTEALTTAILSSDHDAKLRIRSFLDKTGPKVRHDGRRS
jgi:(methylthio)acryloyl-CoA hydratase